MRYYFNNACPTIAGHYNGVPITIAIDRRAEYRDLHRKILAKMLERIARERRISPHEVGFIGKLWRKAKNTVRDASRAAKLAARSIVNKKARKVLFRKLKNTVKETARVAKKVYTHPAFAAAVTAAGALVPGGAAIAAGYYLSRKGLAIAENLVKGKPGAINAAIQAANDFAAGSTDPALRQAFTYVNEGAKALNGAISPLHRKIASSVTSIAKKAGITTPSIIPHRARRPTTASASLRRGTPVERAIHRAQMATFTIPLTAPFPRTYQDLLARG